jgi:hypothetical protein
VEAQFKQCCGSGMFIPDPGSDFFPSRIRIFHPGSRIRIKEFKYFNPPKKWFLSSRKYDPGCSSRIPDPDPYLLPIQDPGVKRAPGPGSLIPDPDPQHWFKYIIFIVRVLLWRKQVIEVLHVEKIHQLFRPKMRQFFKRIKPLVFLTSLCKHHFQSSKI